MNKEVIMRINKFSKDRNWDQFHTGVHLASTYY